MTIYKLFAVLYIILFLLFAGFIIYLRILIVKALRKYINSGSEENAIKAKNKKNSCDMIENNPNQEIDQVDITEIKIQKETKKEELEEDDTDKSLAELLKENRVKCKMTQEFVSEKLGVSRQAVSKWENGSTEPSTSNLIALAELYEVSAEELLKNATKKNKN